MATKILFCFFGTLALTVGVLQAWGQKAARSQAPFRCGPVQIPTTWAFDNAPGSIENNDAFFTPAGSDTIQLLFRNTQPADVKALQLVVEYIDARGELVTRVPMYAHVDLSIAHVPTNVLKPANSWGAPLENGQAGRMVGQNISLRTGYCPVRARVTFARMQFDDGSSRTYSNSEWRLDASPAIIPVLRDVPPLPVDPPGWLLAKVRIGASGDITDLVPEENSDARLVGWIRDVMAKNWKFHPAILNGHSIESELDVLFQINAKGVTEFTEKPPILRPVTLIRFVWTSGDAGGRLMAMYGILPEGSSLPTSFQPLN